MEQKILTTLHQTDSQLHLKKVRFLSQRVMALQTFKKYLHSHQEINHILYKIEKLWDTLSVPSFYRDSVFLYLRAYPLHQIQDHLQVQLNALKGGTCLFQIIDDGLKTRNSCLYAIQQKISKLKTSNILRYFQKKYTQDLDDYRIESESYKQGFNYNQVDASGNEALEKIKELFQEMCNLRNITVYVIKHIHSWRIKVQESIAKCNYGILEKPQYYLVRDSEPQSNMYLQMMEDTQFIWTSVLAEYIYFEDVDDVLVIKNALRINNNIAHDERGPLENYFLEIVYPKEEKDLQRIIQALKKIAYERSQSKDSKDNYQLQADHDTWVQNESETLINHYSSTVFQNTPPKQFEQKQKVVALQGSLKQRIQKYQEQKILGVLRSQQSPQKTNRLGNLGSLIRQSPSPYSNTSSPLKLNILKISGIQPIKQFNSSALSKNFNQKDPFSRLLLTKRKLNTFSEDIFKKDPQQIQLETGYNRVDYKILDPFNYRSRSINFKTEKLNSRTQSLNRIKKTPNISTKSVIKRLEKPLEFQSSMGSQKPSQKNKKLSTNPLQQFWTRSGFGFQNKDMTRINQDITKDEQQLNLPPDYQLLASQQKLRMNAEMFIKLQTVPQSMLDLFVAHLVQDVNTVIKMFTSYSQKQLIQKIRAAHKVYIYEIITGEEQHRFGTIVVCENLSSLNISMLTVEYIQVEQFQFLSRALKIVSQELFHFTPSVELTLRLLLDKMDVMSYNFIKILDKEFKDVGDIFEVENIKTDTASVFERFYTIKRKTPFNSVQAHKVLSLDQEGSYSQKVHFKLNGFLFCSNFKFKRSTLLEKIYPSTRQEKNADISLLYCHLLDEIMTKYHLRVMKRHSNRVVRDLMKDLLTLKVESKMDKEFSGVKVNDFETIDDMKRYLSYRGYQEEQALLDRLEDSRFIFRKQLLFTEYSTELVLDFQCKESVLMAENKCKYFYLVLENKKQREIPKITNPLFKEAAYLLSGFSEDEQMLLTSATEYLQSHRHTNLTSFMRQYLRGSTQTLQKNIKSIMLPQCVFATGIIQSRLLEEFFPERQLFYSGKLSLKTRHFYKNSLIRQPSGLVFGCPLIVGVMKNGCLQIALLVENQNMIQQAY